MKGERDEGIHIRGAGMAGVRTGDRRDGKCYVGDGRIEPLLTQIEALLEIDAKGQLAPHGIGGLARELLARSADVIIAMSAENSRLWNVLTLSDAETRQWFIGDLIRKQGFFNRADISAAFRVSIPQASTDIQRWLKSNPGKATYNSSAKRYERVAALQPVETKGERG